MMFRRTLPFGLVGFVTTLVASASAESDRQEAIEKELNKIAGTWRIVSLVVDGNRVNDQDAQKFTVVNQSDGTWTFRSGEKVVAKGKSTFDPTLQPKTVDIMPTEGDAKGQVFDGIYELGQEERKICFAPVGKPRPTEFASPPGSGQILVKLERASR